MEEVKTSTWPQSGDIQRWLREIADYGHRRELDSRLHETDKGNRFSATFELILHHIFKKRGYSIERHPKIVGSTRTPDYKVEQSGFCFYLEARAFADSEVQKLAEGVVFSRQIGDIYSDLQEKSTRYGQIDSPYVIAIWSPEHLTDEYVEMGFLFGEFGLSYELQTKPGQKVSPPREVRRSPTGLFHACPQVSAVAIYEYVRINDDRKHTFRVYHNPQAALPLDRSIFAGYPQAHRREIAAGKYTIKWEV